MTAQTLAILLADSNPHRAHTALMLAATAAALGRRVTLFATQGGAQIMCAGWSSTADEFCQEKGVAGIGLLLDAAVELGVRLLVCETALKLTGIGAADLRAGVEVCGMARFLEAADQGQMIAL